MFWYEIVAESRIRCWLLSAAWACAEGTLEALSDSHARHPASREPLFPAAAGFLYIRRSGDEGLRERAWDGHHAKNATPASNLSILGTKILG